MQPNEKTRIISIFAGRFPGEKAAAIFEDLNAESFATAGHETIVVAPRRIGRAERQHRTYRTILLPTIDVTNFPLIGPFAGYLHTAVFTVMVCLWLMVNRRPNDIVISNEAVPLLAATYLCHNTMYEMHDFADRSLGIYRRLFRRVRLILVTNEWKQQTLVRDFKVPADQVIVERNAVNVDMFGNIEKNDARAKLGLPKEATYVVYTGHLYEWKGADALAQAASQLPNARVVFVGGTSRDVARFSASWGSAKNITIVGQVPHELVPFWQAAADVLVLPNSGKEDISVHYTSPMKLFEYLASERPIVASDLPSIKEILPPEVGYYASADDPQSFAEAIQKAISDASVHERVQQGRELVLHYSWQKRAQRIIKAMQL
jgi:glycosyltransferase involved in cell wall biosynthesis